MKVEGYTVEVQPDEGRFVVSVPELPGCSIQVDKIEDAEPQIKRAISAYLLELSTKRPLKRRTDIEPAPVEKKTKR